jgi:hypothetical protein
MVATFLSFLKLADHHFSRQFQPDDPSVEAHGAPLPCVSSSLSETST